MNSQSRLTGCIAAEQRRQDTLRLVAAQRPVAHAAVVGGVRPSASPMVAVAGVRRTVDRLIGGLRHRPAAKPAVG